MAEHKKGVYGEERRRRAKHELRDLIAERGGELTLTKLLALFSYNTGFSVKRAEEYLNELVELGMVKVDGEEVSMVRAQKVEEEAKKE